MRPAAAALTLLVLSSALVPVLAGTRGFRVLTFNCSEPSSKDPEEDPWIAEEWENVTASGGQRKILGSGSQQSQQPYERLTLRVVGQGEAPTVTTDTMLKDLYRADMAMIHTNQSHGLVLPEGIDPEEEKENRESAFESIRQNLDKPADVKFSVKPAGMLGPQPKERKVDSLGVCVISSSVGSRTVHLPITLDDGSAETLPIRMYFIRMSVCKTYKGKGGKKKTATRCQTVGRLLGAYGCKRGADYVTCGEKVRSALAGFI